MTEKDIMKAMDIVNETAQLLISGQYNEGYNCCLARLQEFKGETAEVQAIRASIIASIIAMLTEEVNAKRHEDITETFGNIRDCILAGRVEYLPMSYQIIVRIATVICGDIGETYDLFRALVKISADVTEECGVYAGGF